MSLKYSHILHALLVLLALFAGAGIYLYSAGNSGDFSNFSKASGGRVNRGKVPLEQKSMVNLYFADRDNYYLRAEKNTVQAPGPVYLGRRIMENLIQGPRGNLAPTLPKETALLGFYIDDHTAYVDLSIEARTGHPGGAGTELLTVFSIVNSLVFNIDEVEAVKILLDGREADTLCGHVDLRNPFEADLMYIR